jgi:hypothetical protein
VAYGSNETGVNTATEENAITAHRFEVDTRTELMSRSLNLKSASALFVTTVGNVSLSDKFQYLIWSNHFYAYFEITARI